MLGLQRATYGNGSEHMSDFGFSLSFVSLVFELTSLVQETNRQRNGSEIRNRD